MGVPAVFGGLGNSAQSGDGVGYTTPRPMLFVADDVAAGEQSEERAVQLRREAETPGASAPPTRPTGCAPTNPSR
jgi:hypothetical protein